MEWWTFSGLAANQTLVQYLRPHFKSQLRADNLWINLPPGSPIQQINEIIKEVRESDAPPEWELQQPAADLLKFGDLLPPTCSMN